MARAATESYRAMDIQVKSVREAPSSRDGERVLVDRLWPRGVSKQDACLDDWVKDLAPSDELRRWFAHDSSRFKEFRRRYVAELRDRRDQLTGLRRRARDGRLTLLYGARDDDHNNAVVLADVLRRGLR